MKLNAPKQITWLISVALVVLGVIAEFVEIGVVSDYKFWIVTAGAVLLALATYLKGL